MPFNQPPRLWYRLGVLLLAALLSACTQQAVRDPGPIQPVQSPNDPLAYRFVVLDNGLQVLLVSDPSSEKAAASLDVFVGSSSNPPDRGGLAHFLEHMLFLGTEKYPDSGEYATFISENGGSRNAYTGFEHTNYFFDVNYSQLAPALDRFAQFFISPSFDEAYVSREVNAVEAEYQLSIKTDARRNLDVYRELANPNHPFSILGVGTKETLADRPGSKIRDELLAFYRKYYSANMMALVVLGRESLDELEVLSRDGFSAVPNYNVSIDPIAEPLYPPDQLPLEISIQPEASANEMLLSFAVPDYRELYHRKPLEYIGNLLGHEGQGSLLSVLKEEGWAEGMGAGAGIAYRGGAAFNLSLSLTEQGMREREQVLRKVFEYIALLREAGPSQALYQEQGQLRALQFRFREKVRPMSYVRALANDIHYFEPGDVLRGNYLMDDFQPAVIDELVRRYLVPENLVITVISKELVTDRESAFYATPYSVRTRTADNSNWSAMDGALLDERLHLPVANEFIADRVELRTLPETQAETPRQVVTAPDLNIWFRQSDKFRVPRGVVYASFRTPVGNRSALDSASAELYVALLRDAVNEYTYAASLAGLNFSLYKHARGISLKIAGYDDKQLVLLNRVVGSIVNATLDTPRFNNIRDDLVRSLENRKTARPFQQVMAGARQLLMHGEWSDEALLEAMRGLQPEQIEVFAEELWSSVQADVLINGNHAPTLIEEVQSALAPLLRDPAPASLPDLAVVRIDPGQRIVHPVSVEHNDAVMFWYMQAPADELSQQAHSALTGQILKADFFEQLRTEQQLGYVVSAFYWPLLEVPGVAFMVQSPGTGTLALKEAVDGFLAGVDPNEEQFGRHKRALIQRLLEPHKNLGEESEYFWLEISRRHLGFDQRQKMAAAIEAIGYEPWLEWFQNVIMEQRAAAAVIAAGRWEEVPPGSVVESVKAFQKRQPTYLIQ